MRRPITTLTVCCTLALTAGCGSSSKPAGSSSTPAGSSSTTGTTGTTAATAATTSTATSTAAAESLKANTTPRYAAPAAAAPVQSGVVQIAYRNVTIEPDTLRVKVGSTIKWTNYDSVEHNVTSEGGPQKFASKDFGKGGTFEIRVNKPGVIHYECTAQPASMNGTIEVVK